VVSASASVLVLSTGSYQDVINWYCSLLTRRTVCGRAAGNTLRTQKQPEWKSVNAEIVRNSVLALQDHCSYKAPTTNHHIKQTFDQLRCCICFRVSLLACSAPWLSGVLSELKPGFLQIVFSRIRGRVHDNRYEENYQQQHQNAFLQPRWQAFYTIQNKCKPHQLGQNTGVGQR